MEENAKGAKMSLNSISSLFSDAWKLYQKQFSVLAEIILLPLLIAVLGYILFALGAPFSILGGVVIFVAYVIFAYSALPLIFSIHHDAGVDASYKATLPLFWALVWIVIVEVMATIGGFVMLIIPGIWLSFAFSFVLYILVIEKRRGIDALRQSKDYIKGYWWAFFGRAILLSVIFWIIFLFVHIPFVIIGGVYGQVLAQLILSIFIIPFSMIYNYLIYKNLRELKPELIDKKATSGTQFIKTAAVVGVIGFVFIIATVAILFALMAYRGPVGEYHYMNEQPPFIGNSLPQSVQMQ